MGTATRLVSDDSAATATPSPSSVRRHPGHSTAGAPHHTPDPDRVAGFESFAATLRLDLAPRSVLERLLVDRLTLAAWRLQIASLDELTRASEGELLSPPCRNTLRAERSLETALELLATARSVVRSGWGHASPAPSRVSAADLSAAEPDGADDEGPFSNEWPVVPDGRTDADGAPEQDDDEVPTRWQERLVFDENVSDSSPVVKGTWVTVRHVVSLIVDGWTWTDVLRTHPELTEDDVRTCLAYTVEQDNTGAY